MAPIPYTAENTRGLETSVVRNNNILWLNILRNLSMFHHFTITSLSTVYSITISLRGLIFMYMSLIQLRKLIMPVINGELMESQNL